MKNKLNHNAAKLSSLEPILSELANRVISRLDFIKINPSIILDCGSGLGIDYKLLSSKYTDAKIIELDIALAILKLQQQPRGFLRKLWGHKKADPAWLCADALALPIDNKVVDFVYANLLLPYLTDIQIFIKEVRRVLKVGSSFCFAGLGVDSFKELRSLGLTVPTFPDMHDVGDMLIAAGFSNPVVDTEYITLEYENLSTLISDLKLIGAGPAFSAFRPAYHGKDFVLNLKQNYQQPIKLTLEMFVAHGWKEQDNIDLPAGLSPITFNTKNNK